MKNKKKVVLIVLGFSICLLIGGAYLYLGKKESTRGNSAFYINPDSVHISITP